MSMRRAFLAVPVVLSVLFCGGCERAPRPDADILGNGLRNAARGIAAGRAFDDALIAARREDSSAVENAVERLDRAGAPQAAWPGVAQSLNEIGYPLAESGRSMADFRRAEELTRRSLYYWDKIIANEPEKSESLPFLRFQRALGAHDSLAWALYRQGRFAEALREQNAAVVVATANAPKIPVIRANLADMNYHLGKIYQALGNDAEAQKAFAEALKYRPDHPETQKETSKSAR